MEDHESTEAAHARAKQENPIIMYLIVRESLNMSIGKTAAQCGHASQMLILKFFEENKNLAFMCDVAYDNYLQYKDIFAAWLKTSFRKVVLKADEKEWVKVKDAFSGYSKVVVVDAGLTELQPNTETVIGLMPMYKDQVPKVIKKLQVLK